MGTAWACTDTHMAGRFLGALGVYRRAVDAAWAALTDGDDGSSSSRRSTPATTTSSSVPDDGSLAAAKASVALTQQEQWDLEQ
eukprot:scaffold70761_cov24-Tisochrysis_lutea.AAC.1